MVRLALVALLAVAATAEEQACDDEVALLATDIRVHAKETQLPWDSADVQATNKMTLPKVLSIFEDQVSKHGVQEAFDGAVYAGGLPRVNTPKTRVGMTAGLLSKCGFGTSAVQPPRRNYYINYYQCPTLPFGVTDFRGEWQGAAQEEGILAKMGLTDVSDYFSTTYRERIEQCEDRVMISTDKGIRDFPHADGTLLYGALDYDAASLPGCHAYSAAARFDGAGCLAIVSANHAPETRCLFPDGTMRLKKGNLDWIVMHKVKIVEDFKTAGPLKAARQDMYRKVVEMPQMPR